jgi:hypothetical protein
MTTPRLLFPEDVAALSAEQGRPITAVTVRHLAKESRQRHDKGVKLGVGDLPLPRYVKRKVITRGGHERTAKSPCWTEAQVITFLANRKGPGGRPAPPLAS